MNEFFKKLVEGDITPNSFYVLTCIYTGIKPNNNVSYDLELHKLLSAEWVRDDLSLTQKSLIFIEELSSYFRKTKKKSSIDLMGDNFSTCIKKYNELFPSKKLGSGKYARTNIKTLEASFRWFFETYDYEWKDIYDAAKKYVKEYEMKNYEYMRTSQYFIRKQNLDKSFESDLATYCDMLNEVDSNEVDIFRDKIV